MNAVIKLFFGLIFILNIVTSHANPQSIAWFSQTGNQVKINVDLFLSSTCEHCHKADEFFNKLEKKEPWLIVRRYLINQDKSALQTFFQRLQQQEQNDFSVPAIFFCDAHWTGFANEKTSGKVLLQALNYCRQQISKQGELSKTTIDVLRQQGKASELQIKADNFKSAPKLIIVSALTDALSACSLFLLMIFFSFMILFHGQKWWQFFAGMAFILSLAVVHYIEQAHGILYYQMLALIRLPAVLAGMALLFCILRSFRGRISPVIKGVFFSLIIMATLLVYMYQQTCGVSMGLVFQQWLVGQVLSDSRQQIYHLIYQAIYLLPLLLLLAVYLLLSQNARIIRYQRRLKISACFMLSVTGLLLVISPQLLANLWLSFMVLFMAIILGWIYVGNI